MNRILRKIAAGLAMSGASLLLAGNLPAAGLAGSVTYDVMVYDATPGGIAYAVRAAREGLTVLLVTHSQHVGGALSNGLSTMDTLYNGFRAPLYDELRQSIYDYYREKYGANSEPYRVSLPNQPKTKFEAHVVEQLLAGMLARESRITVVKAYYPVGVERDSALIRSVTFQAMGGNETFTARATVFADCSYEGDLAAVAKVPWRYGRESNEEFHEEHAGRIFMKSIAWPPAGVDPAIIAEFHRLNVVQYDRWYRIIRPESTGAADKSVQAFNMRTVVTNDPANRLPATAPEGYDRAELVRRLASDLNWGSRAPTGGVPNRKAYLNLPELVGVQNAYVEGDWAIRQHVVDEHDRLTRGLIYFMQNDESVSPAVRQAWREWGLARDEFADNHHMPYEVYVREARRIEGRAVFTENDARPAPGLKRAPVQADAISITDWFLDSHACTPSKVGDSLWEGELLLNYVTVPGQVSYRTLLPQGLDNLLVPVCASSSHIGWGAIRLEPTWMSLGEAAAYATWLAVRQKQTPATIDPDALVRLLAEHRILLSFFNDVEVDPREPWIPAVQYLGTKGFFATYDAQPLAPLTPALAQAWIGAAVECVGGVAVDPTERARQMLAAEEERGDPVMAGDFAAALSAALLKQRPDLTPAALLAEIPLDRQIRLSRASACRLIYAALKKP